MDAFMDIGKRYGIAIGKNCSKRSGNYPVSNQKNLILKPNGLDSMRD
jgi:hypothetical protein